MLCSGNLSYWYISCLGAEDPTTCEGLSTPVILTITLVPEVHLQIAGFKDWTPRMSVSLHIVRLVSDTMQSHANCHDTDDIVGMRMVVSSSNLQLLEPPFSTQPPEWSDFDLVGGKLSPCNTFLLSLDPVVTSSVDKP